MSGKRILLKTAVAPVVLILLVLKVIVKIGTSISSIVLGALILFTVGCIVYTIVKQVWSQTFVLVLIEAALIAATALIGVLEGLIDVALMAIMSL